MATQGKVAFITGANKGIGLETARGLGQLGIAVVIGSRIIEEIEAGPADQAATRASRWLATIRRAMDMVAKRAA